MPNPATPSLNAFAQMAAGFQAPLNTPAAKPKFPKPKHTPVWVWDQYLTEINSPAHCPGDAWDDCYLAALDSIVRADKATSQRLWVPLERRAEAAEKIRRARTKAWFGGEDGRRYRNDLQDFASIVASVQTGFNGHYLYTKKERVKSGVAIEKHARGLAEELIKLMAETDRLPSVIVKRMCEQVPNASQDIARTMALLDGIANGGQAWQKSKPLFAKPTQGDSKRTMLLRLLTSHFVMNYGTRLSGVTLAVAGLFYYCENLSESGLSKLAPVLKREKTSGSNQ